MRDQGLSVEFPEGLQVCKTMSMGYAFSGFRADLDTRPTPCNALDASPTARISITAEVVAGPPEVDASRFQIDQLCNAYPPASDFQLQLAGLVLTDRPSEACVIQYSTKRIQFYVMTEGIRPEDQGRHLYVWGLLTTPDRAPSDLAVLRDLIAGTRLDFTPAQRPS